MITNANTPKNLNFFFFLNVGEGCKTCLMPFFIGLCKAQIKQVFV